MELKIELNEDLEKVFDLIRNLKSKVFLTLSVNDSVEIMELLKSDLNSEEIISEILTHGHMKITNKKTYTSEEVGFLLNAVVKKYNEILKSRVETMQDDLSIVKFKEMIGSYDEPISIDERVKNANEM